MVAIPENVAEANPAWLTERLQVAGILPSGHVSDVAIRDSGAFNSATSHLRLSYSPDAPDTAPHELVLKLNGGGDGEWEVGFYRLAAAQPSRQPMLVACYGCDFDAATGRSYLLLQDMSASHQPPSSREQVIALQGVPDQVVLEEAIDTLAQFHAYWWQHPLLGSNEQTQVEWWYGNEAQFHAHIALRVEDMAAFKAAGAELPTDLAALYDEALAKLPILWPLMAERVANFTNLTLTHNDLYFSQMLAAKQSPGQLYIIDFDSVSANFGAFDLANLCANFWTTEQRHDGERELNVLRRYHAGLLANGVRDYSWEQLLLDYRLMLIFLIFPPVWDVSRGAAKSYWWAKLQCITSAYRDWQCADLLAEGVALKEV